MAGLGLLCQFLWSLLGACLGLQNEPPRGHGKRAKSLPPELEINDALILFLLPF